jgi:hypothetical protein
VLEAIHAFVFPSITFFSTNTDWGIVLGARDKMVNKTEARSGPCFPGTYIFKEKFKYKDKRIF